MWWRGVVRECFSSAVPRNGIRKAPDRRWLRVPFLSCIARAEGGGTAPIAWFRPALCFASSTTEGKASSTMLSDSHGGGNGDQKVTCDEMKRLMRLVNLESLKMTLGVDGKEVIPFSDLLHACQSMGVARSHEEAVSLSRALDEAGVIFLFRDMVHLHPDKIADLVRRALPLALTPEDEPMRAELKVLMEEKEGIDLLAHKQVRRVLWCGLGLAVLQVGLFFRLTFWEFSWDVMEPIAFFVTATGIVVGYAYFLFTAKDPSYQDLMKRLFLSRQKKLFAKHKFDVERYKQLQKKFQHQAHITVPSSSSMEDVQPKH